MKKDGLLFLGLAAIGVALYFVFKGQRPAATRPETTGSLQRGVSDFLGGILNQRVALAGKGAGGGSIDMSGTATAGVNALASLAKLALEKLFGGGKENAGRQAGTSPGTSTGYGVVDYGDKNFAYGQPEDWYGGGRDYYTDPSPEPVSPVGNSSFPDYNSAVSAGGSLDAAYDAVFDDAPFD